MEELNATMISHVRKIGASAVLVYVDVIKSREQLSTLFKERRCILAARYQEVIDDLAEMEGVEDRIISVDSRQLGCKPNLVVGVTDINHRPGAFKKI